MFISLHWWLNTFLSLCFIFPCSSHQIFAQLKWYLWLIMREKLKVKRSRNVLFSINSSGVSHSDGSCVLGRIHSDVSSNIPKKVYHIVTDNFVNLLHISYAWLYKTECWGRKFHAFSFNSHRNCKIFMTNFNFIFDTICVPYIFRKSIFGWNCDHDTPLCDTPLLEDTPLCDTPDELLMFRISCVKFQERSQVHTSVINLLDSVLIN